MISLSLASSTTLDTTSAVFGSSDFNHQGNIESRAANVKLVLPRSWNTAPPPEMYYVTRVEDFHLEPGFTEALRVVLDKGYAAVVVTNQKCVARGLITMEDLAAIHEHLRAQLAGALC